MVMMKVWLSSLFLLISIHNSESITKTLVAPDGTPGLSNLWDYTSCVGGWAWANVHWTSCELKNSCFLYSEYWPLKKELGVKMAYVNVSFYITTCASLRKSQSIPTCSNNFALSVNIGNKNIKQEDRTYKAVSNLPSVPGPDTVTPDFFQSTTTVAINDLSGKDGFFLRFDAANSCGNINKLKVYYYECPNSSDELVEFKGQAAPDEITRKVAIPGTCVLNSVPKTGSASPIMDCWYDGSYNVTGACHCNVGYTKKGKQCEACGFFEYKKEIGNQECSKCGKNSKKLTVPRVSCQCEIGYYKQISEKNYENANCYMPPAAPENIQAKVNPSHVFVSWTAPTNAGSAPLGDYVIQCINCPNPQEINLVTSATSVNITGLGGFTEYQVKIGNTNNITNSTGVITFGNTKFTTEIGRPGIVQNVKYGTNNDGSVTFTWDPPFVKGGANLVYVFEYGGTVIRTAKKTYTISTGTQDKTYTVQISAETTSNGTTLKGPVYKQKVRIKGGISLQLAIGVAVGVILFVVLVLVVAFFIWRRRNPPYLNVVRMEDGTVKLPGRLFNVGKLYVDPTTYNDVDDAVQEFAYELQRKDLKIGNLLGGGEFAEVYKGSLFKNGKTREVAIKTLKSGAIKRDRDDFLGEAAILGQFADTNVISLEGVILKDRPNVIVLEFMANGALDKYLQENDNQFTVLQLLGMARGVASGMKYLSELGFIHRDLAARNILVDDHMACKISDFGMSREIKVDETYDTQGGKIPVRWTAPEAIQFKKFTTASDVWSYGILLWEIMSYGERPYWEWGNYEVLERLNAGYRLPPPMSCPKVLHDLMLYCWAKDRTKRPKFGEIRDLLEKWIRNPDLLQEIASVITKTDENLDYTVLQTINKWLEAIGMSKYTSNFIDQGFATPRQILDLTLEDLEALGIGPIGHRKKVYKAIQNTKIQVEARHNSVSGRKRTSVSKKDPPPPPNA